MVKPYTSMKIPNKSSKSKKRRRRSSVDECDDIIHDWFAERENSVKDTSCTNAYSMGQQKMKLIRQRSSARSAAMISRNR